MAQGRVWTGATTNGRLDGVFTGRNLRSGEVEVEFPPNVKTYWFHHRCHRGKATEKYLLTSRTGIEFVDMQEENWIINHWIRGACLYGIMPCNGLIYAPPHPCACYPEAKQNGFSVVAPGPIIPTPDNTNRLEKGPAYRTISIAKTAVKTDHDDWPTYRGDNARTSVTSVRLPGRVLDKWTFQPPSPVLPTAPIAVGDTVFVADRNGSAVPYALFNLEPRGRLLIEPGTPVYEGMVIGEHNRGEDINVNPCKEKKLSNMRAAGKDEHVILSPVKPITLEQAISFIREDELVEITPQSVRMRKAVLSAQNRHTLRASRIKKE